MRENDREVLETGEKLNHMINAVRSSKKSFKFGQHYSIILAKTLGIIFQHPSWLETGELIEIL